MATFFELLDLNPWREEKLEEETFLEMIQVDSSPLKRKYAFASFEKDMLYPLHMICTLGASADAVKACYKAFPEAMNHELTSLGKPLHYACAFGATVDVVHFLAKKDPAALLETNKESKTPLHLACSSNADPEVVILLTERCPAAAGKLDANGYTPLNLAVTVDEPKLAVIEDLTEVNAGAGVVKAKDGTWPLWNAVSRSGVDVAVLKDLIISNPESAKLTEETSSSSVLLRAIEKQMATLVIKDLIKVFPEALKKKDAQGRLPLHVAIECKSTLSVIELLVKKYPESVEIVNKEGETPHAMADRLGLHEDIVQFLNPFEEVSD